MSDIEADLLGKARRGEPSAAPFLVSYYGERLLGFARAHAPDLSDPDREQIVELAIEAGVRSIRRFDEAKGTLLAWFRGQVRYQTLGWRRSHPPMAALSDNVVSREPPVEPAPATIEALRAALARLSHDDQVILALRNVEGLAYSEIAQRLGISDDATRQRHKRALKRLRVAVRDEPALRWVESGETK